MITDGIILIHKETIKKIYEILEVNKKKDVYCFIENGEIVKILFEHPENVKVNKDQ